MRSPGGGVLRLALPFRAMLQRLGFALLIATAFALMLLGRLDNAIVEQTRLAIVDAVAPIMEVVSRPAAAFNRVADGINEQLHLRREVVRLQEENLRLRQWQTVARQLEADNAAYRSLLSSKSDVVPSFVSARVIADAGAPFVRTVLLNAGFRDGIRRGQAVMNADGLVGRIAEVGGRSSRVLLLSDLNSRVPVLNSQSSQRGVLSGDNSDWPNLVFLPNNARVTAGDRIVTSGHGGLFPRGLPVGVVGSIRDGKVRIQPFVDWDRLEFVRVVRFDVPKLAPAGTEVPIVDGEPAVATE